MKKKAFNILYPLSTVLLLVAYLGFNQLYHWICTQETIALPLWAHWFKASAPMIIILAALFTIAFFLSMQVDKRVMVITRLAASAFLLYLLAANFWLPFSVPKFLLALHFMGFVLEFLASAYLFFTVALLMKKKSE